MGYGAELGAALADNTSVTKLDLRVQGLLGQHQDDTSEELQTLLQFIATSQALRTVRFCGGVRSGDLGESTIGRIGTEFQYHRV
jgi:hypothetical protein